MKSPLKRIGTGLRKFTDMTTGMFKSKYTEIILAVGLFILLDTGVLIINFYTSYQIANDAHAIQLASRMGTMSQTLLHELYQVYQDLQEPDKDYTATVDKLADTYKVFDETLDAFIYGGELIGVGQGKDALLKDTVYRDTSANILTDAENIWKQYRVELKPIVYSYFNDIEKEDLIAETKEAIEYSRKHSGELLNLMQSFSVAVEGVATRKAERLRMIQSTGITLAVINFFLILFHFLRRLKQSDKMIEKSRKETENILLNVNEGLFLLDRDFNIGSQHSASLNELFQKEKLAGQNFIDLLGRLVSEKTLDSVKEYTEILFSPRVNESLITDLNPLDQVEVNLSGDDGVFNIRYFSFQFSRVEERKGFNSLLVTVKDITETIHLSEQLKVANEKASREIDMLLTIIHVDNTLLSEFLQVTGDGLDEINVILKSPEKEGERPEQKLEPIGRIVHKLKGDSTVIGLDFLVDKFHRFELEVNKLRETEIKSGEAFLPLVVALKQLISDFLVINKLKEKMNSIDLSVLEHNKRVSHADTSRADEYDLRWMEPMKNLVEKVAKDCGKEAVLDLSQFDPALLSDNQLGPVRDIVVQSLRNAVTHGLESPDDRSSLGKSPQGRLEVELKRNGSGLKLIVRDDGKGIDLDQIRSTAISKNLFTEDELVHMERPQLLSMLFSPGFSTSGEVGLHAGQGVGMDLVKQRVLSLKGRVKLRSQKGLFTEFHYTFSPENSSVN